MMRDARVRAPVRASVMDGSFIAAPSMRPAFAPEQQNAPDLLGPSAVAVEDMPGLSDLDQFKRFAAGAFDHDGTGGAKRVGLAQEGDPFGSQLGDPGIEI